ncbi:MAG: hypothetical protein A2X18_05595 [Bacteroidetes bacterium GWF2_40_14]|nr:MAG: hypothetical protein A2X18_05595 [Bacteroidetes bacterium GWF2_40_14]
MKNLLVRLERIIWAMMRNYMPRWTIFAIDLFIVIIAYTSLWFFRDNVASSPSHHFALKIFVVIIFYAVSAILFKTHHGVVRYSTISDLRRLSFSTLFATLLFEIFSITINGTNLANGHLIQFNLWFPVVLGFVVIAVQLMFRFMVKTVYEGFEKRYDPQKIRAFVLGSDYESVLLANSIKEEKNNPYEPVAFITLNDAQVGRSVGGLPILSARKGLLNLMVHYEVHTLLLYKSQLDSMSKEFYDRCIVEGLELLMVSTFVKHDDTVVQTAPQINKIKIEDLLGRNAIELNKDALEHNFTDKVVLITGAAGSIGSEIAIQVAQFKCRQIILLDQAETPLNDLWLMLKSRNPNNIDIKPIIGNVSSTAKMRQVFECARPHIVFHAAAYKHVPMMEFHPSASVIANVLGTKNVADMAVETGVERFVMISTDKAVNPTNVMGASKRAAEIYIHSLYHKLLEDGVENPTQFVTTRFGNVLGSNGSVVPLFKRQIAAGGPITVTHKDITRYFMTIPEACSLVLEAGCMGHGGEIFIFDMGEAVKIYELAEKMIRLSGKIPGEDIKIVETGLRPGEKLYEELLACDENTLPTHHKKVKIAKVRRYRYSDIAPMIDEMNDIALEHIHPVEVVKRLKELIPEFISQNSPKFEELDKLELYKNVKQLQFIDK